MAITIILNKPYGYLTQFTGQEADKTLAEFNLPKEVYPAGRLDKDSEGLLILTSDGKLQERISHPKFDKEKTYWVQIENIPSEESLEKFRNGLIIKGHHTKKAKVKIIDSPVLWHRDPPIRERKNIPTCWIEVKISEGKNRQVRRMTAAIGHPTLRLVRVAIANAKLGNLQPGQWQEIDAKTLF